MNLIEALLLYPSVVTEVLESSGGYLAYNERGCLRVYSMYRPDEGVEVVACKSLFEANDYKKYQPKLSLVTDKKTHRNGD